MRNSHNILYNKFRVKDNHYIYDTYSNEILQVSEVTWDIVDDYLCNPEDRAALFAKYDHSMEQIRNAIRDVEEGIANGYLHPLNVTKMHFYSDPSELLRSVRCRLPQLSLDITERCNFRCRYCEYTYDAQRRNGQRDMSWKTALNAINVYTQHSKETDRAFSFWGGEPLLNFPLIQRVVEYVRYQYPKDDSVHFSFTTNATCITEEIAEFLITNNFNLLVSLDGPRHIHDKYRVTAAGNGTFDKTVEGLRRILRKDKRYYKNHVRFNCVLTPKTSFSDVFSFFSTDEIATRAGSVTLSWASDSGHFFPKYGTFTDEQKAYLWTTYCKAAKRGELNSSIVRRSYELEMLQFVKRCRHSIEDRIPPNGCCAPLLKKMHVDVDGNIHVCQQIPYTRNAVGNVNANGINYQAIENLVKEYTENSIQECRYCWAVRLCNAVCYKDFIREHQWDGSARLSICGLVKNKLHRSLQRYSSLIEENPNAFDYLKRVKIAMPV